jgi:hypothetical protein
MRRNNGDHLRRFNVLRDASEMREPGSANAEELIAASRLIAYAKRCDAVADLEIERLLRRNPRARMIHHRALTTRAQARSNMAMAAAGGTSVTRRVGAHRVELLEEADAVYLVIYLVNEETVLAAIEARDSEGSGARLALGAPIGGIIQLRLDLSKPEPQQIHAALLRPDSSIFLL